MILSNHFSKNIKAVILTYGNRRVYLGYDADRKNAFIPNYEVATSFEAALQIGEWKDIAEIIEQAALLRNGVFENI